MAENKKISEFLERSELTGQEMIPLANGGGNGRVTAETLKGYCATPIGNEEGTAFPGNRGQEIEDAINNIANDEFISTYNFIGLNSAVNYDINFRERQLSRKITGILSGNVASKTITIPSATTEKAGVMSAADKKKLDSLINVKDYAIYIDTYNKDSIALDADTAAKIKSNEILQYIIDAGIMYYVYLSIINDYYIIFYTFGVGISDVPTKDIVVETRTFQFEKSTNTLTWYDERMIKLTIDSDGTKFLSDDGTYKAIEIPDISNLATKDEVNAKLSTETYNADKTTFATKTELNAKVSGTGVTQMQVVTALPESPDANTLYIVTAAEEPA